MMSSKLLRYHTFVAMTMTAKHVPHCAKVHSTPSGRVVFEAEYCGGEHKMLRGVQSQRLSALFRIAQPTIVPLVMQPSRFGRKIDQDPRVCRFSLALAWLWVVWWI